MSYCVHNRCPTLIEGEDKGSRIVGFASGFGLEILQELRSWYIDGTFFIVSGTKDLLYQLYVIIGFMGRECLHCVPERLPRSTMGSLRLLPQMNSMTQTMSIERAALSAIREVFPVSRCVFCDVHLNKLCSIGS